MPPPSFGSIQLTVLEEMSFEEFQDDRLGNRLGYRNGTILAFLNLYIAPIIPSKFWLNLTYGWEEMSFLKNFKMAALVAILDIGTEPF